MVVIIALLWKTMKSWKELWDNATTSTRFLLPSSSSISHYAVKENKILAALVFLYFPLCCEREQDFGCPRLPLFPTMLWKRTRFLLPSSSSISLYAVKENKIFPALISPLHPLFFYFILRAQCFSWLNPLLSLGARNLILLFCLMISSIWVEWRREQHCLHFDVSHSCFVFVFSANSLSRSLELSLPENTVKDSASAKVSVMGKDYKLQRFSIWELFRKLPYGWKFLRDLNLCCFLPIL